jgi:lysophospholipase L1-like esterase
MNCGLGPEKFRKIYGMLIDDIKECLPDIKIIILEPFILKGKCTEELWDAFNADVRRLAEIAKQVAEYYNFTFVPLQNKFDSLVSDGNSELWTVDGIHPTAAGHGIIKEELLKAFLGVM